MDIQKQRRIARSDISVKSILIAVLVIIATITLALFVGIHVHSMERTILRQKGELIAKQSAREFDNYLHTRANMLRRVGYSVEEMLSSSNEDILSFLTDETQYLFKALGSETTGLYGWVNGEYLDGAGWVPDDDYVATERPWYKQATKSDRDITFVEPYLDLQTNTVMLTIAERLSDGESVVAMDVSLEHIQKIVEDLASSAEGSTALVLDSEGVIVAHSEEDQVGHALFDEHEQDKVLSEKDQLGHTVAEKLLIDGQHVFEVKTKESNYVVYAEELEGGWYSVSIINTSVWNRPMNQIMAVFFSILALIVLSIIIVFLRMSAKNVALEKLNARIIEEKKRGEELQILSETDRMTGLNDRVNGARKVNEIDEAGLFLAFDIDHFKSINDRFGHQTGDAVILAVANALKRTFRSHDVIMRLGGDEFGVFAVGVQEKGMAEMLIGRLFDRIEKIDVLDEPVCVSVGAAIGKDDFDTLYRRADEALYQSKRVSGNYVVFG